MNTVLMFFTVVALNGMPVTATSQIPTLGPEDCRLTLKSVDAVNKYSIDKNYAIIGSCEQVKK